MNLNTWTIIIGVLMSDIDDILFDEDIDTDIIDNAIQSIVNNESKVMLY